MRKLRKLLTHTTWIMILIYACSIVVPKDCYIKVIYAAEEITTNEIVTGSKSTTYNEAVINDEASTSREATTASETATDKSRKDNEEVTGHEDATGNKSTTNNEEVTETKDATDSKTTTDNIETAGQQSDVSLEISSPCAILIEPTTGTIIYEKNADEVRPPASVTKIMTLLLTFDAIDDGRISLTDEVVTSEHAASMGGSQVFLEAGEIQTVETLIKCISVASGNDACVAMAEYIDGSEQEFVNSMNERASALGMSNTHFVNCCGLDADGHVTTARDISLMSRELILKHPEIFEYCSIWMENITHVTRRGSSEFGLANTNKLLKQYEYATGLKTGYTSIAKYCISATARRDGLDMIAVIMGADNYRIRTKEAIELLNYGFANTSIYKDDDNNREKLLPVDILNGIKEQIVVGYKEDFSYLTIGKNSGEITKSIDINESIKAPVKTGDVLGKLTYYMGDKEIGTVDIIALEDVRCMRYLDYLKMLFKKCIEF